MLILATECTAAHAPSAAAAGVQHATPRQLQYGGGVLAAAAAAVAGMSALQGVRCVTIQSSGCAQGEDALKECLKKAASAPHVARWQGAAQTPAVRPGHVITGGAAGAAVANAASAGGAIEVGEGRVCTATGWCVAAASSPGARAPRSGVGCSSLPSGKPPRRAQACGSQPLLCAAVSPMKSARRASMQGPIASITPKLSSARVNLLGQIHCARKLSGGREALSVLGLVLEDPGWSCRGYIGKGRDLNKTISKVINRWRRAGRTLVPGWPHCPFQLHSDRAREA
jgi:hypothetical protein